MTRWQASRWLSITRAGFVQYLPSVYSHTNCLRERQVHISALFSNQVAGAISGFANAFVFVYLGYHVSAPGKLLLRQRLKEGEERSCFNFFKRLRVLKDPPLLCIIALKMMDCTHRCTHHVSNERKRRCVSLFHMAKGIESIYTLSTIGTLYVSLAELSLPFVSHISKQSNATYL